MNHIIVFFLYFTTDWCSSRWASACTEGRAAHAGYWMFIYHSLHALAVLCIVNDPWCIIALALGGLCGTRFAVNQRERNRSGLTYIVDSKGMIPWNHREPDWR